MHVHAEMDTAYIRVHIHNTHILVLICVNCCLVRAIIAPFQLSPVEVRPRGLISISFSNYYSISSFSSPDWCLLAMYSSWCGCPGCF